MKSLLGILLATLCWASVAQAESMAPDVLIRNTVQEVLEIIRTDEDIKAGDLQKTLALVDDKVLPHFDFKRMSRLAVGKYWRRASVEQRQALTAEFRNMLVRTYTKVFSVYRDQVIEVKPLKAKSDEDEVTVKTTITKPGSSTIPVNYEMKLRKNGWKVFDIYIEGVSMVMSYRSTFGSQIQESGIDGLIKAMAAKNSKASISQLNTAKAK
ncbi:MAG: ABC transporter substrate-binding protein [Gallionella sp.]